METGDRFIFHKTVYCSVFSLFLNVILKESTKLDWLSGRRRCVSVVFLCPEGWPEQARTVLGSFILLKVVRVIIIMSLIPLPKRDILEKNVNAYVQKLINLPANKGTSHYEILPQ
ncbi:hypothetical protein OM280_18335 [Escherichia albertii]|nr:hypothetical protein [Escherichia albertii]